MGKLNSNKLDKGNMSGNITKITEGTNRFGNRNLSNSYIKTIGNPASSVAVTQAVVKHNNFKPVSALQPENFNIAYIYSNCQKGVYVYRDKLVTN